jgi:hypothetical protein
MKFMKVFENRVLRRILGPKGNEMVGGWRKPHNRGLHNLCSSPNKIRKIKSRKMRLSCSTVEEKRDSYRILMGKLEGKSPLGRTRLRWEASIKTDFG